MGAEQSSARGGSRSEPAAIETQTCYYELLGISRTATDDEIKKAYRKKALELHPDRNYGDVENATALFAEIQAANEVLSDPQERAWYDSHRDAILNHESASEYAQGQSTQVTSAARIVNLISKFNSHTPFTDAPDGFYGSLRQIFQTLADEEDTACEWEGLEPADYPDFGSKDDVENYEEVVKPFYVTWTSFSTKRTFSWKDVHRLSEAPDRYVRRFMEKENKQLREKAIREFNDTVRSLALFARKRDPRYRPNTQSEADRQKILRDASLAQAKKARAANAAKLASRVVPEWTKSRSEEVEDEEMFSESEEEEEEADEEEELILRCDFCNKTFKSEQQFEAHEKSKKHTKIMQQVRRQMQKENKKFKFDEDVGSSGMSTPAVNPEESAEAEEALVQEKGTPDEKEEEEEDTDPVSDTVLPPVSDDVLNSSHTPTPATENNNKATEPSPTPSSPTPSTPSSLEDEDEDEDYAPRSKIASRLVPPNPINRLTTSTASTSSTISHASANEETSPPTPPVLGKAKAKRAKKLAAQQASATREHICGVCAEKFDSKTKLFRHVKDEDHAVLVSVGGGGDGGGKGGRKGKKRK